MGLPAAPGAHTLVGMGTGRSDGEQTRAGRLRAAFLASFLTAETLSADTPSTGAPPAEALFTDTPSGTAAIDRAGVETEALPVAGLTLIRSPGLDLPGPFDRGTADAAMLHGRAVWLGEPDAVLYRVDDERWLLPTPRRARELARDPPAAPSGEALAGTAVRITRRGPVVARLRMVPGEGAALPVDLVARLDLLVRARVDDLAGVVADQSRPWWRPSRPR
ncbi:hypothetical protein [Frankia canadensis]|uniref:hypothetical protein n=1 Tax=Frankia canadensis TaxID=1836972 RepID=UPI001FAFD1C6|nr:hypothetical protein [Frankia canadensis]